MLQFELFSVDLFDEPVKEPLRKAPSGIQTVGRCTRCGDYVEKDTQFCHCQSSSFCGCRNCEQIGSLIRSLTEEKYKARLQGSGHIYQQHVQAEIQRLQSIPICEGYRKKEKTR